MFNALKYTKKLEQVGFTKQQAETALELGIEVMNDNLASKEDLNHTTNELRHEMRELSSTLRKEMSDLRLELKQDMGNLQDRLTIRMGGMFAATIAILASLKFL